MIIQVGTTLRGYRGRLQHYTYTFVLSADGKNYHVISRRDLHVGELLEIHPITALQAAELLKNQRVIDRQYYKHKEFV